VFLSAVTVRQADLSANKPFHVEIEKLANTLYCPDGIGRWFYERAAGSYNVCWPALDGVLEDEVLNSGADQNLPYPDPVGRRFGEGDSTDGEFVHETGLSA